jgi:protein-tyrosine phosphatase
MTPRHAELIKQYLKRYIDEVESVIVHCEGGISRSAGIMAAIQKYLLGDDSAIRKDGRYLPNGHCYELMLNALESY